MLTGWKTLIFGAMVTALGALSAADLVPFVGEEWGDVAFAVVGVIIMALRVVTTTPVFTKE